MAYADDIDAPHGMKLKFEDGTTIKDIIKYITYKNYLAAVSGGKATWSVSSNVPLAVISQNCPEPIMLPAAESSMERLDVRDGILYIHFSYHGQIEAEMVKNVLWSLTLRAE